MSLTKVLIVEDEVVIAEDLMIRLESLNYLVTSHTTTGETAVEAARVDNPDLVLMDIVLHGEMDGIEAAEIIKNELQIPIIFLTAYQDENIVQRAKIVEPFGYILKPFQTRELSRTIEMALHKAEMDQKLRISEKRYRNIFEGSREAIFICDEKAVIVEANEAATTLTDFEKEELVGRALSDLNEPKNLGAFKTFFELTMSGQPVTAESTFVNKEGDIVDVELSNKKILIDDVPHMHTLARDISMRKVFEKALRNKERELWLQSKKTEKSNAAFKALANNQDEKKEKLKDNIMASITELVKPYIQKLKETNLSQTQKTYVENAESALDRLTSPFAKALSSKFYNLTPTELKIAAMVKDGQSSADIGRAFSISENAVSFHRKSIRRKFNISNKKVNLATFLEQFEEEEK